MCVFTHLLNIFSSGHHIHVTGIIYTESGFQNYGAMADAFLGTVLPAIPAHRCGTAEEVSIWHAFVGLAKREGVGKAIISAAYTTISTVNTHEKQVSSAVVFLLSDAAVYTTGQTIAIAGGMDHKTIPLRPDEYGAALLPVYGDLNPKAKL